MKRSFSAAVALLLIQGVAQAQPAAPPTPVLAVDAWRKAPYQLTLVLYFDPHPLLTKDFVDDLRDEVRDALQRDLQALCHVEVVNDHPLLNEILAKGWNVLDNRRFSVDDQKLHFLRVTYDNGQYAIQARQVDGSTALVSPLRKMYTPDRLWVARLVALTVAQDFGMVAQVGKLDIKTVTLLLKGSGVSDPDSVAVRTGDVFAVAEIRQGPDGKPQGLPVADACLVVSDVRAGEVTARLFSRYKDPLKVKPDRLLLGYRALKLGTQRTWLQLRVVDANTKEPLPGCGVKVYPSDFEGLQTEELSTNAQGRVRTKDTYKNIVFVKLSISGVASAEVQVPFPLLSDQPIEYPLAGSQQADALARLEYRNRQWVRQALDIGLAIDVAAQDVRDVLAKTGEKAAADKALEVAARLESDVEQLKKDLEELREIGKGVNPQHLEAMIARSNRKVAQRETGIRAFEDFAKGILDPSPARIALNKARFDDHAFNAEAAIAGYEQSLKADDNQPEVKERLQKIKDAWALKGGPDGPHAKARKFVFESWGKLEAEALEKGLPEAKSAFKVCQQSGNDFFTAYKLFKLNEEHLQRLAAQRDQIANSNAEDAQERIDAINKLGEEITKFNEEVAAWIDRVST